MNKTLLSIAAFLALGAMTAQAQKLTFFEEAQIAKISEDGKYAVATDGEGNMTIYNVETEEYTIYEAGYDAETGAYTPYLSAGFGNVFSAANVMVGNYDDATPAIWKDGDFQPLPITNEDQTPGHLNSADAITADGKRICGGIAPSGFGMVDDIMMVPVIWEQGVDGNYGIYKVLPYPQKDFTGRVPQYVTARGISDDGKTVVGQIVDYSGYFPLPIVYRENEQGEWSYEIMGADLIYNATAEFPAWPENEPKAPDATLYMDADGIAAYNAAIEQYNADVNRWWNGEIDDYPVQPDAADYVTDVTGYNAACDAYNAEAEAYNTALDAFFEVFNDFSNVYGPSYNFNSIFLSRDGKSAVSMYSGEDPDAEVDEYSWDVPMFYRLVRFDLTAEGNPYELSDTKDAIPTGYLNDGSVVYASPASEYARSTYFMPAGKTSSISMVDYLKENAPEAAALVEENLTFQTAEWDEDWNVIPGEEVVSTGTVVANGTATAFGSWLYNGFYGDESWFLKGYVLTTGAESGIKAISSDATLAAVTVTDLNGKVLYKGADTIAARKAMNFGVNLLTTTLSDGTEKTVKVTRH